MSRFDATPLLVDARAAADAYAPGPVLQGLAAPLSPVAVAAIRHAQVEIYCDHDRQAIADIHAARNSLLTLPFSVPSDAFTELDQAVWRMRHHDYRAAEQALERALTHLHPGESA